MKMYKIYGHKSPSNKYYVGRTGQKLERRWRNGEGYKKQPKFYNAIKKYGWDNFEHILIAECETEDQSILVEAIFKRIYDSIDNGYNILFDESVSMSTNATIRQKLSDNHWSKKLSAEDKKNAFNKLQQSSSMVTKGKKRPPRSQEWRDKLSASNTGKKASDETKAKMSEAHKGNKSNTGRVIPEEQKQKISDTMKRVRKDRFWSSGKKKRSKAMTGKRHTEESKKNHD